MEFFIPPWMTLLGKTCENEFREKLWGSGEIELTWAARSREFDGVEVDHGGGDVGMSEKALDG